MIRNLLTVLVVATIVFLTVPESEALSKANQVCYPTLVLQQKINKLKIDVSRYTLLMADKAIYKLCATKGYIILHPGNGKKVRVECHPSKQV